MRLRFERVEQGSQVLGGDEHLTATIYCTITPHGGEPTPVTINVKQTVGDRYSSPLEVSKPVGYSGPIDMRSFQKSVDQYYRRIVHVEGDSAGMNLTMTSNTFGSAWETNIPQPARGTDGW